MAITLNIPAPAPTTRSITDDDQTLVPSDTSSASSPSFSLSPTDVASSQSSSSSPSNSLNTELGAVHVNENSHPSLRQTSEDVQNVSSQQTRASELDDVLYGCHHAQNPRTAVISKTGQHQHPRRTKKPNEADLKNGNAIVSSRPPPALVRQCERKDSFVDSLVDTTTEMIETIWPLSVLSFGLDSGFDNKDQNIIGLRTFVQEVLRRSKTSYSTLQVALYYVVLIRSRIPKHDFTMEQVVDSHSCRAMQCGRRMFLAALILASKYLQDRNFSARAWSRISGLTPYEINTNEMAFLSAVNWKLHIPEPLFSRWTDLVLKYSLSSSTSPRSPPALRSWRSVIPYLTPDLDHYELEATSISCDSGYRFDRANVPLPPFTLPTKQHLSRPVEVHASPEALTLQSGVVKYNGLVLANKGQPGAGPLLTPRATPKMTPLGIPAASTPGLRGGVASMKVAMAQVKTNCLARSTWDSVDCWKPSLPEVFPTPARRSSLAPMNSTLSSPESMISDNSSRSSRSSSISSVASSTCAPLQPRLALQATRRSAKMQLAPLKENQYPIMHISPNGNALQDAILASPHVMTIPTSQPTVTPCQPTPEAPVINPCDILRAHDASAHEAATTLRDLALNLYPIITCSGNSRKRENPAASDSPLHNPTDNQESGTQPNLMRSRKRERTSSIDLSVQSRVRDLIAPRCLGDITNGRMTNPGISTVLPDRTLPDSILGSVKIKPSELGDKCSSYMVHDSLPRKRACGLSGREESRRIDRLMKERAAMPAPGMWEGII